MVADRTDQLARSPGGADAELRGDIANLESQLSHYQRLLDEMELDPAKGLRPGKGYVAALSAETWFPAAKAEVQALEAKVLAMGRPDYAKLLDDIADLEHGHGRIEGFELWAKYASTRNDMDQMFAELLEARRLAHEDPKAVIDIAQDQRKTGGTSLDLGVKPAPGATPSRQVEVMSVSGELERKEVIRGGISHGATALPSTGLPGSLPPGGRESTVQIGWPPANPVLQPGGATREFEPNGDSALVLADGRRVPGKNIADEILADLERNIGLDSRVPYLTAVNIVDRSGKLVFRFENADAASGTPRWSKR